MRGGRVRVPTSFSLSQKLRTHFLPNRPSTRRSKEFLIQLEPYAAPAGCPTRRCSRRAALDRKPSRSSAPARLAADITKRLCDVDDSSFQLRYTKSMAGREEPQERIEPDPVIEAFKKDIDRTLFHRTLQMTVEERLRELMRMHEFVDELRRATRKALLEEQE